jgi:Na+-driven multidrug efflux pump
MEKEDDEPPSKELVHALTTEASFEDSGDLIAKELRPLEDGFSYLSQRYVVDTYLKLVGPAFYLGVANYGHDILNMFGFYLANKSGRVEEQSSFGLMVFFTSLFIHGLFYSIDEKIGVSAALAFGAKDYKKVNVLFWQGLLTIIAAIVFLFTPIVVWSESIFLAVGMTSVNATLVSRILNSLFPIEIWRMANEATMTFVLAQGTKTNFGTVSCINMFVSIGAGLIAHAWFNMGLTAWLVSRAVHELVMSAMVFYPFVYQIEKKTKGFITFQELFSDYVDFLKDCSKYVASLYCEYIGCEVAIYFTGITQDMTQIAAHTALSNVAYFMVNTGLGFSTVGRTRVNMLLGRGLRAAARNFFVLYLCGMILTGFCLSLAMIASRPLLVYIYAGENPEVAALLSRLLLLYAIFLPADFIMSFLFTVCRSTNQILLSVVLNLSLFVLFCVGMDYYLIVVREKTCRELIINMYLVMCTVFALLILRLTKNDWSKFNIRKEALELD